MKKEVIEVLDEVIKTTSDTREKVSQIDESDPQFEEKVLEEVTKMQHVFNRYGLG